jgi:hypothetical protein
VPIASLTLALTLVPAPFKPKDPQFFHMRTVLW